MGIVCVIAGISPGLGHSGLTLVFFNLRRNTILKIMIVGKYLSAKKPKLRKVRQTLCLKSWLTLSKLLNRTEKW